jgi:predicted nucleic acid-binding protein
MELLLSTRNAAEFDDRRDALDGLRQISVGKREWQRAEEVCFTLAEQGPLHHRRVPTADLLIAATAELAELHLLHYDRHFELIASITGQPVRAIAPLGSL